MKGLNLLLLIGSATIALSVPAQAQLLDSANQSDRLAQAAEPSPAQISAETQLTPELSEPLEVDQTQFDDLFAPPASRPELGTQSVPPVNPEDNDTVGPPAASQVPEQNTDDRLEIPIQ